MHDSYPEISIIVPIYNMERFLPQCLESIRTQSFGDWECILVDDGSTDRSHEICSDFSKRDPRYKIIRQENSGVAAARNTGLDHAKAEFIGFVDPDDWIEPDLFNHLLFLIRHYNADIAQVGYWREYRGRRSVKHLVDSLKVIDGNQAMQEIAFDRLHNYLWNRLHRKSIINCRFPEGRVYEDIYAYGHWLKKVGKMVIDPLPLYHYRMRKGSIVHDSTHRLDFFQSCLEKMNMIRSVCEGEDFEVRSLAFINRSAVNACKIIARQEDNEEIRYSAIEKIIDILGNYPLPSMKYLGAKTWWRAWLMRNHPNAFCRIMRAVNKLDIDSKHRLSRLYD